MGEALRVGPVALVPARIEHAFVLATHMRAKDVAELAAAGQTPLAGVLYALQGSEVAYAALYDDAVGAMFGVVDLGGGRGLLWLLTAELFGEKPLAFTRAARRAVAGLLETYTEVVNAIDVRYRQALDFAVAMGAELLREVPVGPGGAPFMLFRIRRR